MERYLPADSQMRIGYRQSHIVCIGIINGLHPVVSAQLPRHKWSLSQREDWHHLVCQIPSERKVFEGFYNIGAFSRFVLSWFVLVDVPSFIVYADFQCFFLY